MRCHKVPNSSNTFSHKAFIGSLIFGLDETAIIPLGMWREKKVASCSMTVER